MFNLHFAVITILSVGSNNMDMNLVEPMTPLPTMCNTCFAFQVSLLICNYVEIKVQFDHQSLSQVQY